ncbi:Autophagy-related protein 22-like protein [Tylopilus felleus]
MLLASPQHPVHSEGSTEVKETNDAPLDSLDKIDKSPVLIATVQKDEPVVSRKELWSYYLYCNGDNTVGPMIYTPTLFQNLATAAGYDPIAGPGSSCLSSTASGQCVLPWMGGTKPVTSVILVASGIGFALMTVIFTVIGSVADYGTLGRWILLIATIVSWVSQYACMALTCTSRLNDESLYLGTWNDADALAADRWKLAMWLFIAGFVSCGGTLSLVLPYSLGLPGIPHELAVCVKEYEREESLEMNKISNISTVHNNIGYVATYLLNLALLLAQTANDPKIDNYTIVLCVLSAFQTDPIVKSEIAAPPIGFCSESGGGFNTTAILVAICQNNTFQFSFLQNTYLGLVQAIISTVSTLGFWYIQQYWKVSTKNMFLISVIVTMLIPLWGMIGIWTHKFGFRNPWEYWAYNVVVGLFQAPYYAYSQTMMAELCPPGFDNMFFSLFNLSNRASSIVGPYVVQAIIDKTQNDWQGFPFLFAICTAASLLICFGVDVEKGRRDAVRWAAAQRG